MQITSVIWDKQSPINGKDAAFLTEHFKKANGNDDRVIIAYDGVISRIQYVDDKEFTESERQYMSEIVSRGVPLPQAIAETWLFKVQEEERMAEEQAAKEIY